MAFAVIAKPGSKLGPCKKMCQHKDCAAGRAEAEKVCPACEKLIGYDTPFVTVRDAGGLPWTWHNECAEIEAEKVREPK